MKKVLVRQLQYQYCTNSSNSTTPCMSQYFPLPEYSLLYLFVNSFYFIFVSRGSLARTWTQVVTPEKFYFAPLALSANHDRVTRPDAVP